MENLINFENLSIDKICRICLIKKEEMSKLSENSLCNLLFECASIKISENEIHHLLCCDCIDEINRWYTFKQRVQKSFEIGQILLTKKIEEETQVNEENDIESNEIIFKNVGEELQSDLSLKKHGEAHNQQSSNNARKNCCEICGKSFCSQYRLVEHMRTHTGERPFKCEECNRTFTRKILLKYHILKKHKNEKPFSCTVCSKSFFDSYRLKVHTRLHTGDKPFTCSNCPMAFPTKAQLESHIKYKHTKIKDFICNFCARAFAAKYALEEHIRTHTGERKESKHICGICNKKYSTTTLLKNHMKSQHTGERPHVCDYCQKRFALEKNLRNHLRIHTGDTSFMCDLCGKSFSTRSSLTIHVRVHTGERPYQCSVCQKSFSQRSTLKTHLKIHSVF